MTDREPQGDGGMSIELSPRLLLHAYANGLFPSSIINALKLKAF